MLLSYSDADNISSSTLKKAEADLLVYQEKVDKVVSSLDSKRPEYALAHSSAPALHKSVADIQDKFGKLKHLVLIGIGGSSMGAEAVHAVLGENKTKLHVLDSVSANAIENTVAAIKRTKKVEQIGVCVVSKSGTTTETITNAEAFLTEVEQVFGKKIYRQTVCVGEKGNDLLRQGKSLGCTIVTMPESVSGRFSVGTEAGLVPLAMLGHDVDAFVTGINDSNQEEAVRSVTESATRLNTYLNKKYSHYNFFAFETRLEKLGEWYRQLFAESLGKAADLNNKPVSQRMVPTVSTSKDLHSMGQLYLSGLSGVYTDFVVFDDLNDMDIAGKGFAKNLKGHSVEEVATAIYGGVINTYREKNLPYRSTILTEDLAYSLGLFMGMRMREVMYVAKLQNLNAFDQPNVESYKKHTKQILGL